MTYLGHVFPFRSIGKFYQQICFEVAQAPPAQYTVRPVVGCEQYSVEHKREVQIHIVHLNVGFPATHLLKTCLKASPEVLLKQTAREGVEVIKRQHSMWVQVVDLPEYVLLGIC